MNILEAFINAIIEAKPVMERGLGDEFKQFIMEIAGIILAAGIFL